MQLFKYICVCRSGVILDPSLISVAPPISAQLPTNGYVMNGQQMSDRVPPLTLLDVSSIHFYYYIILVVLFFTENHVYLTLDLQNKYLYSIFCVTFHCNP